MIPAEAVEAALQAALPGIYENLSLPYGASANDYPNHDDLRAADEECERKNNEMLREILRAALEAAAPHIENPAYRAGWAAAKDFYGIHDRKGSP